MEAPRSSPLVFQSEFPIPRRMTWISGRENSRTGLSSGWESLALETSAWRNRQQCELSPFEVSLGLDLLFILLLFTFQEVAFILLQEVLCSLHWRLDCHVVAKALEIL